MRKKVRVLGEYIGHLVMGACMFTALLLFGGALNVLVRWTAPLFSDQAFVRLMENVEKIHTVFRYCLGCLVGCLFNLQGHKGDA
jgi:hypothetical protein